MASFIKTLDEGMKTLVFTKFKSYLDLTTETTDLVFAPNSIAQRMISEKRGANKTEFMNLWRPTLSFDWGRQRSPLARRGMLLRYEDADTKVAFVNVKAVPVKIGYDLYFWSRSLDKIMQAAEAYAFWLHVNPRLILNYNDEFPLEMYMKLGGIVDVSPLDQVYDKGTHFVYRMPIGLEGWVLVLESLKSVLTIILKVWYNEGPSTAITSDSRSEEHTSELQSH